ncbi:MAG: hypothetical protein IPN10_08335 [Saprospiraceae bacterium]|nr:hypothetical protein [Saprospiraceae bacterium]
MSRELGINKATFYNWASRWRHGSVTTQRA